MKNILLSFLIIFSTVAVAQTPVLYMSADTICINHVVTYSDSTITPKPCTYQWIFTGGNPLSCSGCVISGDTVTVVLSSTLTPYPPPVHVAYHVSSALYAGGCFPSTEKITNSNGSDSIQKCVTVLPFPTVYYTLQKDTTAISTWNIYPHYMGVFPADSMNWNWGDGTSTTAFYPSHTYAAPGRYNICMYAYSRYSCFATSCSNDTVYRTDANSSMVFVNVIDPASGVQKFNIESTVDLFPNPANTSIVMRSADRSPRLVQLFNTSGKLVLQSNFSMEDTIDISHLPEGIYSVRITTHDHALTKKLVIMR